MSIRYGGTPAGRVAYSTVGTGPPSLLDSGWIPHLRGQSDLLSFGRFVERLVERFTVVRYDKPGCGLSDRDDVDLSFEGQVGAALAVVDAVGAPRFRLFGASQGGQLAAVIAARCPERVEALVVYGMFASGRDLASPAVVAHLLEMYYDSDIRAVLPTIRTPSAVLRPEADRGTPFELGRDVAAHIPLPGTSHLF